MSVFSIRYDDMIHLGVLRVFVKEEEAQGPVFISGSCLFVVGGGSSRGGT